MKNYSKYLFLAAIFIYSCHQGSNLGGFQIVIDVDNTNEINASSFIEDFSIIRLSTDDNILIHHISKVQYINNKIFILDIPGNSIFIFNTDGSLYYRIRRVGQGPGEYAQITDFFVSNDNLYLLDFTQQFILRLNENHEFIERIRLEAFSSYFVYSNSFFWTYGEPSPRRRDYQFSYINSSGEVVSKFLPRRPSSNLFNWTGVNVFHRNNNALYLSPRFGNVIYRIKNGSITPVFSINFGRRQFPVRDNVNNHDIAALDFRFLLKHNFYLSDRFLIFDFFMNRNRYFNVYDRIEGVNLTGVVNNDLIENFRFFPQWGNDHYLIEVLCPEHLLNDFAESPQFADFIDLSTIKEDDNPLIIIYRLRK